VSTHVLFLDGTTGASRELLGGKAWSIERMRALGVRCPPAFALGTDVCRRYHDDGRTVSPEIWDELPAAMESIAAVSGRRFGDPEQPLLVSVRSGAATSMPGMMDTILNLGINDAVEKGLALASGDAAYAADTRRRFIDQFEKVVGSTPPEDPWEQLKLAIVAVLDSWQSRRAIAYRRDRGISDQGGTAVTVQAMVFGNLDDDSGTGVLFTRDPLSGGATPYGEWLSRGQGEDVVSGRSNARPISDLATAMPSAHADLMSAARQLEKIAKDVQDIEFTIESGNLWLLQTRSAKRTAEAAVRHAVQLHSEGIITVDEALLRVTPELVDKMMSPHVDPSELRDAVVIASGKQACQGVAVGVVVTDVDEAEDRANDGESIILVRPTTDPDDVAAMSVVAGVLTELGGSTSHAAVVCRELNTPCVVACGEGLLALEGQEVTVDANSGTVYRGSLSVVEPAVQDDHDLEQLLTWVQDPAADLSMSLPQLLRRRQSSDNRS
jgi:pyruvate,orthophosphate dikinase